MLGKANAVVLCFVLQLFHCVFLIGGHQSGGGGGQKSMSSDKATSQAAAGSSSMGKRIQNLGVLFFNTHTLAYNLYAFIPLLDVKLLRMEAEDLGCSVTLPALFLSTEVSLDPNPLSSPHHSPTAAP